jgi:hypothetical protein
VELDAVPYALYRTVGRYGMPKGAWRARGCQHPQALVDCRRWCRFSMCVFILQWLRLPSWWHLTTGIETQCTQCCYRHAVVHQLGGGRSQKDKAANRAGEKSTNGVCGLLGGWRRGGSGMAGAASRLQLRTPKGSRQSRVPPMYMLGGQRPSRPSSTWSTTRHT